MFLKDPPPQRLEQEMAHHRAHRFQPRPMSMCYLSNVAFVSERLILRSDAAERLGSH